jgi:multidrug efflux pump subunit AcrB/outer membrane protein TolC
MNPVRASLRFPQVTLVLTAMLFIGGVTKFLTMPRREDPKITIRTGLVIAEYPGATAEEVESQVTHKIEERLFRFEEVRREKTYSTSRNGLVIINVELNKSVKNSDQFWSKLRLDMAVLKQSELPSGVRGPIVDSDFGDTVAALIAVKGGHYGYRELKDYAQRVESAIRQIPAASKIKRIGDQKESIEVTGSWERLSQYGVDPGRIEKALQGRNTILFGGRVQSGDSKVPIEANGQFQTEEQIRKIMVDVSQTGQPIYLGDLANVKRVYKDPTEYARIGGEPAILLSVEMHEGNNIVEFGKTLHGTLKQIQTTLPPDVQLEFVADQPRVVSERVFDFSREFGIAIISVILVTMVLLPMRVALVSAVAIPVTVSLTFGVLNAAGIELHQVSIAALIVVLGMVVDDAIVIADNYVELLDHKVPIADACWRCASEMAVPVLAATLTIIASFLPLLTLSGASGEFIRALPISVAIALSVSFVVAMMLTPMTAGFFIKKGLHDPTADQKDKKPTALDYMQRYYNRIIVWAMRHRKKVLISGVLAFVGGIGILSLVRQQFFPLAERDQFVMDVWLPEGTRIEATDAAVRRIEGVLSKQKEVRSYTSFLGSSFPRFYYNVNPVPTAANYAQILVNTHTVKGTPKLVEQLREELPFVAPEAKVFVKELQQGDVMEAPVEVSIVGDDLGTIRAIGEQVQNILNHTPGAIYVHTDWHEDQMLAGVNLRQEVANRLGFTNTTIANELAGSFDGETVTTFWEGDRDVDINLRLGPAQRQTFQNISDTYMLSPVTGARVPVGAFASLAPEWHLGRIVRRNGVRTLTVRAFPDRGRLASQILTDVKKQINNLQLPQGYRIEYGGEDENQRETFGEMRTALAISLLLIFLILLLQFRTLADALIVMAAFPLALPGAAFGLFVTHNPFGFTAFIGVISLGGLVVRNSIILVDYIHERMKHGIELEEATLEAGERRLRPIFLTTMAAAVGVTPMIISRSSMWSPLASVIAFGLLGSMFFTLVVIPVLFVVVNTKKVSKPAIAVAASVALLLALSARGQAQQPEVPNDSLTSLGSQQRSITLDESLQLAMKKNSTVRIAEQKVREADAKVSQAKANYFPVISNETNAIHVAETQSLTIPKGSLGTYGATGPLPGTDEKISLGEQNSVLSQTTLVQPVSQMFFKIHAGVTAAEAEARVAHTDLDRAQNEVSLNVKRIYYQLLSTQQRKLAAELRIQAGQEHLKEADQASESGVALRVKVLEGEAQVAEAQHALGSLEDQIADLTNSFNDLIGLPLPTNTELIEPAEPSQTEVAAALPIAAPDPLPGAPEEAEAMAHNPELLSAEQTLVKAHAGLKAAWADYIPDISIVAEHAYQNGVPLLPTSAGAVGVRMDWTISEFGKRIGLVRERKAQMAQAQENLHATENRVRMDVQLEARKILRSETGLEAAREGVAARTELVRIAGDQVVAKTANQSALKDAQAQLADAKAQFFDAEMQRVVARAELVRTEGRQ